LQPGTTAQALVVYAAITHEARRTEKVTPRLRDAGTGGYVLAIVLTETRYTDEGAPGPKDAGAGVGSMN
jgi:hypothetical protein